MCLDSCSPEYHSISNVPETTAWPRRLLRRLSAPSCTTVTEPRSTVLSTGGYVVLIPLVAISCCESCSFPGLMECKTGGPWGLGTLGVTASQVRDDSSIAGWAGHGSANRLGRSFPSS